MMFACSVVAGRLLVVVVEIFVVWACVLVAVRSVVAAAAFADGAECHAAAWLLVLLAGVLCDMNDMTKDCTK
jgi:hypothetical protein